MKIKKVTQKTTAALICQYVSILVTLKDIYHPISIASSVQKYAQHATPVLWYIHVNGFQLTSNANVCKMYVIFN